MVTIVISLCGNEEDIIPFHHFFVGMAFLADLGMELLTKLHHFWFIHLLNRNLVETMTVIQVPSLHSPPGPTSREHFQRNHRRMHVVHFSMTRTLSPFQGVISWIFV